MNNNDGKPAGDDVKRSPKPKPNKASSKSAPKSEKSDAQSDGKPEILPPLDKVIDEAEEATQSAATRAISKIVGKITGHTSDSQQAALDSINTTVSELGKLAEGMSSEEKLELAEKMAEAGKGAERVNEDNNSTWTKITNIAIGGLVLIVTGVAVVATKGKILKDLPKA